MVEFDLEKEPQAYIKHWNDTKGLEPVMKTRRVYYKLVRLKYSITNKLVHNKSYQTSKVEFWLMTL